MSKSQTDQSDNEEFGSDGRRAKLSDIRALEAKLAEAMASLKALQDEREALLSRPVPKPLFLANIYTSAVLAGKKPEVIRGIAEATYADYCEMLAGKPRKTIDEIYGGGAHNKDVSPPSIPIRSADAPGLAPISVTAEVS